MWSPISIAIAAFVFSLGTQALVLVKKDNPAVVAFDLQKVFRHRTSGSLRPGLHKRSDEVTVNNENFLWTVTLGIGTPPQQQSCILDTGSSDLVVETDSSNLCMSQPTVCSSGGAYDANSSSTYQYVNSRLNVAYGGGQSATGDYVLDNLDIGSDLIKALQFGVMYQTNAQECIMGISFTAIEGSVFSYGQQYANIPVAMVQQGLIQSNAYSVWLNDDTAASSKLLFGGVDTNKFYGSLVSLSFVTGPGDPYVRQTYVTLQGVQMTSTSGQTIMLNGGSTPGPALLDTGTTFVYLPPAIAQAIYTQLGATQLGNANNPYFVPCSDVQSTETVDFLFSGITIHVSLRQLIYDPPGTPPSDYCELGIVSSSSDTILGDTFLTSVYAVFDLDNKEVHIAPAVYGSTSDNIYQIGSGPNAVPSVTGQPYSTTASSSSTASMTSSSSTMTTSSSSTSSLSSVSTSTTTSKTTISSTTPVISTTSTSSSVSSSNTPSTTSMKSTTSTTSSTKATTTSSTSSPTSKTSTTSKTTTTAKPTPCNHDNCYRAVSATPYTAFCSGYLAGSIHTAPSAISKGCSATPSRISSACSCIQTGG